MSKSIALSASLAALLMVACSPVDDSEEAPSNMAASSDLAQPATGGEALFLAKCGICHVEGGTGTRMLARRLGDENALLAERDDLLPEYIETVVRSGINSMPTITRVEVGDEELAEIVGYLTGEAMP